MSFSTAGNRTTFVLIPGAGTDPGAWQWTIAELRARGHEAVAPALPLDDPEAGPVAHGAAVLDAARDLPGRVVVVGQSLGAFTAPLVCARKKAALLVLVAGLVPAPGEAAADWWADTGYDDEVHEHYANDIELFYQDVPAELAAEALRRGRRQSETPTRDPWPLEAWPDVPTRFILCRNDRLLPAAFLRRVVKDRLGITPDEIDAGHCVALSRPQELADRLEKYLALATAGGRTEP
jgi:pimeloyl-ACP methyl ester carboxylesterase